MAQQVWASYYCDAREYYPAHLTVCTCHSLLESVVLQPRTDLSEFQIRQTGTMMGCASFLRSERQRAFLSFFLSASLQINGVFFVLGEVGKGAVLCE